MELRRLRGDRLIDGLQLPLAARLLLGLGLAPGASSSFFLPSGCLAGSFGASASGVSPAVSPSALSSGGASS